ncbi:neprilysin-1-like [Ornithodoros turicata]|uniref:neprilysin-1-like n=1 Tax=Ornithodoros turicata TaxID=34597 RepID=UPI003138F462
MNASSSKVLADSFTPVPGISSSTVPAPTSTTRRHYAVVGCFYFGVLGIALFLSLPSSRVSTGASTYAVCTSPPCVEYSSILRSSLNRTANPCTNFYSYVCDGWTRKHPGLSVYENHSRAFYERVRTSLRSAPVPSANQSPFQKAARFFSTCFAAVTSLAGEVVEFRRILRQFDIIWPDKSRRPDPLRLMVRVHNQLWLDTLVNIHTVYVGPDPIISVTPSLLNLKTKVDKLKASGRYREYIDALSYFFATKNKQSSYELLEHIENETLEALSKHAAISNVSYTTVEGLAELTPGISTQRWTILLIEELNIPINKVQYVYISNPAHLRDFDDLVTRNGDDYIHWYVGWLVTEHLAPYMSLSTAQLVYDSAEDAMKDMPSRCLILTELYFGWAAYPMYARHTLGSNKQSGLAEIVAYVKAAYLQLIRGNVSPATVDVLESMDIGLYHQSLISDADRLKSIFRQVSDLGNLFSSNWLRVAKAYSALQRTTFLHAHATLQKERGHPAAYHLDRGVGQSLHLPPFMASIPLYESGLPDAVGLGALGSVIARSVYWHLTPSPGEASEEMNSVVACNSSNPEVKGEEVAARVIALDVLWWLLRIFENDLRLPAFEHVKKEKLLFMAGCFLLCGAKNGEVLCNEPVRHNANFNGTFGCGQDVTPATESTCVRGGI